MITDFNQKFYELFLKSGLNKTQFCAKCGLPKQNFSKYFREDREPHRMSKKTFEKYTKNL